MTVQPSRPTRRASMIDYQEQHDRVTTLFRLVLVIPIAIVIRRPHCRRDPDRLRPDR